MVVSPTEFCIVGTWKAFLENECVLAKSKEIVFFF